MWVKLLLPWLPLCLWSGLFWGQRNSWVLVSCAPRQKKDLSIKHIIQCNTTRWQHSDRWDWHCTCCKNNGVTNQEVVEYCVNMAHSAASSVVAGTKVGWMWGWPRLVQTLGINGATPALPVCACLPLSPSWCLPVCIWTTFFISVLWIWILFPLTAMI